MNAVVRELPEPKDVVHLAKEALANGVRARLKELYRTQDEAASALAMAQPNLSPLYAGRYERYSITWLMVTAYKIGLHVEIGTRKCA